MPYVSALITPEAEGVGERVELATADMRELPFADGSFDLVLSNVTNHNISAGAGRDLAIDGAWRVLRRDRRLSIADISNDNPYRKRRAAASGDHGCQR